MIPSALGVHDDPQCPRKYCSKVRQPENNVFSYARGENEIRRKYMNKYVISTWKMGINYLSNVFDYFQKELQIRVKYVGTYLTWKNTTNTYKLRMIYVTNM